MESSPKEVSSKKLNGHILEEQLLQKFSSLNLKRDIHIFDVQIDYLGDNYVHTTRCGDHNQENLVLIHGYGCSGIWFYPMLEELSKKYRVYCIDLLGFGLSSRPKFEYTSPTEVIQFFVESIEQWRLSVGLKDFYLGGHSMGGYMACHYANNYPERIKKLFLISPLGIGNESDHLETTMKQLGFFRRQFYKLIAWAYQKQLTLNSLMEQYPWTFKSFLKIYLYQRFGFSPEIRSLVYDYMLEISQLPQSSEKAVFLLLEAPQMKIHIPLHDIIVDKLSVPVTVYYGDNDKMDSSVAKRIFSSNVKKNFALKIINNSSHQITMEQPVQLASELLQEFINEY